MGMIVDFVRGVGHGLGGLGMVVGRRRMWPLVAWPFVIAVGALVGLVVLLVVTHETWLALLPGKGLVHSVVSVAAWLLVPIVCWLLFLPLAAAIAGPWNDAISEAAEEMTTGRKVAARKGGSFLGDLGRTISQEMRKFFRYLVLAAGIAIAVVVIPVVGPIIGIVGGGYIAARFAAFDSLDATLSRWGWDYERKLAFVRRRRALCLGLGTVIAALMLVPFVNALAMPVGAASGTLLALASGGAGDGEGGGARPMRS